MHELAITEAIVRSAVPKAQAAGAKRILTIKLKLGALSDIVPSYIEYYLQYAEVLCLILQCRDRHHIYAILASVCIG